MSDSLTGVGAAVLATISWSLAPIAIKQGIKSDTSLVAVTGIRGLAAFLILLPLTVSRIFVCTVDYYDVVLILVSAILVGVSDLFYIEAIKRIGSWRAILIAYQYILIAQILAFLILNEVRGIYAVFFTPLALLGIYVALKDEGSSSKSVSANFLIAYIPAILWGVATVISRYLTFNVDAVLIASLRSFFIAVLFTLLGFKHLHDFKYLGKQSFLYLLTSGFFTHVGGFLVFLYALKSVGTFVSTLVNSVGPLITQLISKKLSNERLGLRHLIGTSITTSSVVLAVVFSALNLI